MKYNLIFIITISFVLNSCMVFYKVPKNEDFKYFNSKLPEKTYEIIDTNAFYYYLDINWEEHDSYKNMINKDNVIYKKYLEDTTKINSYTFVKFFGNGFIVYGSIRSDKSGISGLKDFVKVNYSVISIKQENTGYFSVINDTILFTYHVIGREWGQNFYFEERGIIDGTSNQNLNFYIPENRYINKRYNPKTHKLVRFIKVPL